MTEQADSTRPTDNEARALARRLIAEARFGALGVLAPQSGAPMVTRIAVGTDAAGAPVTLVSSLSGHTAAMKAHSACSLLLGEPGPKGDPLTHPRLTVQCEAAFVSREAPEHSALREHWLKQHPKAKLYVDFMDFGFVRLTPVSAFLNGGFGRSFRLTPADLGL